MTAPRWLRRAAAVTIALTALTATAAFGYRTATAGAPPPCPPGYHCITGKLLIRDPGSDTPHQVLVEDKSGAPMFWVDYGGVGSGGEPFCVYGFYVQLPHLRPLACLGGPQGSYGGRAVVTLYLGGRPVTLTARDLAVLAAWAHAREARR